MKGDEELHRTPEKKKTVNPVWNDQFNAYIESAFIPLTFQVSKLNWSDEDSKPSCKSECVNKLFCQRCLTETLSGPTTSWARQSTTLLGKIVSTLWTYLIIGNNEH
jgi:hypothetical protein